MKKILMTFVALSNILASCNNNSTPTTNTENSEKKVGNSPTLLCFAYTENKDSVLMNIKITENIVTGSMTYNLYEKDKNNGTIQGTMKGDTLIAAYKFLSEGIESIREVAFLKKANDFVEGYGDMVAVNNKMMFKNSSVLNFNSTIILKNVACKN